MQSALRRYVPGAVAECVLKGDALAPADFVRHESLATRGRQGRFEVFALPLR
jgi:hypothetical protein